ncbi:formin-like protein 5 [Arachis ipaensis]|uniref:formin-like protein 5 n=1 Tax=Arachis ipaensis TaxID=130454 RepID=UPI000A2B7645|nr:formin-like protein 5 [Arachis ipaensis]
MFLCSFSIWKRSKICKLMFILFEINHHRTLSSLFKICNNLFLLPNFLFIDKVQANSDQAMVWNQLKARSFQFNEEMMESLFGYNAAQEKSKPGMKKESREQTPQYIQIIEPKKAKNLSILLKALNVTLEEVRDALLEGNEIPPEFLNTLLNMAPSQEEERKLRLFTGDQWINSLKEWIC